MDMGGGQAGAKRVESGKRSGMGAVRRAFKSLFNVREGRASYETIRKRFVNGSRLDGMHLCILIIAMLIASIGLNTDSTECIVGAMLICPLMGSVLAISYSVATVDRHLMRDALLGLAIQVAICLTTSTLYFLISPLSTETNELLANSSPTIWNVLVALAGGFAGGLGNSRKQEPATIIAGVAVATALMPPLCASGYGIATRDLSRFLSALYEFALNVVFISFAAHLVLLALRVPLHRDINDDGVVTAEEEVEARRLSRRMRLRLLLATILFAVPCVFVSANVVSQAMSENGGSIFATVDQYEAGLTTKELAVICPGLEEYRVGNVYVCDAGTGEMVQRVVATVKTADGLSSMEKSQVEALIRVHVADLDSVSFVTE